MRKKHQTQSKKFQIDQSGKIEQTNKDTVLCLSNGSWDTVLIKTKTKRQIQKIFRQNGQPRNYVLFTFSAALSILIERNLGVGRIIIDREYFGKEPIIKKLLEEMSEEIKKRATLEFGLVGKSSRADFRAGEVLAKKKKPRLILTARVLIRAIKKTEVGKQLKNT